MEKNYIFFASAAILFCCSTAQLQEYWMHVKEQHKSVGCELIENVKVVSKVECAMLFAQRSDVNLADFNVLQLTCELKFCNQISNETFENNNDFEAISRSYRK